MFWRALTGVHPAGTMNADKLRDRLTRSRHAAAVASAIAIRRCRASSSRSSTSASRRRSAERYANATELLADLQRFSRRARVACTEDSRPYRGLAAFGEDDAKYFFGRMQRNSHRARALEAWPLLAVIGPSGVGKSSFVHAGLVPAVQGDRRQLASARAAPGPASAAEPRRRARRSSTRRRQRRCHARSCRSHLASSASMLREAAARRSHKILSSSTSSRSSSRSPTTTSTRKLFLAALLAAADDATSPVRVVLSMRADFLDRLAGHKHFLERALARPVLLDRRPTKTTCAKRSCVPPSSPVTRSRIRGSSRT